ncbi:MAG: carboxypeptidase regulatory-like domain-containing protein, partial [Acidobacteriota bacterium]
SSFSFADVTGSILGVVRDPSQAVVKGVRVTVTNTQTNLSQESVTGDDGSYHFLALPAGTYRLNATASGFQQFQTTDIVLKVNDQLRVDVAMKVGNVKEEVSIAADAVQVQTESTQLGDVIDSKKMLALPLNGRSYLDLLGLQAGVAPETAGTIGGDRPVSGYIQNAGNVSVNGQRETANAFLVNGGDVSEGRNLGAGLVPNLDSVEEFRLITNSFDAEYGKFSGAVMNAITKSGTNSFHGDLFEFWRNDKLDANSYFFSTKSELRRNQFGGVAGGPFWKDKLFWFTDYQGTRQVQGAETGIVNLPSAAQRQGNFGPGVLTGSVDGGLAANCPASIAPCIDWPSRLSARLGYTVTSGEPYWAPGCNTLANAQAGLCVFPGGVIPQAAWSPAAKGILPYIPAPNIDPAAGTYSDNSQRNRVVDNKIGERVDFNNRKTGNWSFYYHFDDSTVDSALPQDGASVPGFPSMTPTRAQQFVISNTKSVGTTAVNEARLTFFRTATHRNKPTGGQASLASLGFVTGAGTQGIIPDALPGFPEYVPQLYFNNFAIGTPSLITFQPNNTYTASDGFSKVVGKHTLKFGGEFRYLQVNERNLASQDGAFVFDGTVTGNDFADYLVGAPTGAGGGFTQAALQLLDSRTRYGGAYVQDTWKAKPNLTLNLGLRWEVSTPWYDTQGKIQTWVPGKQSEVFPGSPKGLVFPGDPGIPKTLAPTRYNNFGPRVGLAYSPGFHDGVLGKIFGGPGKTSIRAAYGLYYTSVEDLNLFYEVADAPFGLYWTSPGPVLFEEPYRNRQDGSTKDEGQRFPFTIPTPGSPANKTLSFAVYEPMSYFPGYDIHNKLPYAEHFNLSIQRELSRSTVLTLAYVGTEGHRLISQQEVNPGDAALCMALTAQGALDQATGTIGCGPNQEQDFYTLGSQTVYGTRDKLLNPNLCPTPNGPTLCYGFGNTLTTLSANSVYHAGEVTVERKAGDVTLLAAYTLAKALDNSSGFGDLVNFANPRLSRGLSSTDVHHNFVVSYIWELPFDKAFRGLPKRLTRGWQLQGITRFSTGFPIQMNQGNPVSGPLCAQSDPTTGDPLCVGDASMTGSPSTDMPNLVGPVHIHNPRATPGTWTYFDQSAFTATACALTYPNGLTNPGVLAGTDCGSFGTANRRFFHGPGINNTDLGIQKLIPITEAKSFEIRGEFFNIFNHAQFTNPSGDISSSSFGNITSARAMRIGQLSAKFIW